MINTFSVKQYFKINLSQGYEEEELELLHLLRDQLLDLAIQHLTGKGKIHSLSLELDGKTTYFDESNKLITYELQTSLLNILSADRIELRADYYYETLFNEDFLPSSLGEEFTLDLPLDLPLHPAGPMFLDIFLDGASPELLKKLEFGYHLVDDQEMDQAGILVCFNKDYQGQLEPVVIDEISGSFSFISCGFPVFIDDFEIDKPLEEETLEHVRELEKLSKEVHFDYLDGILNFHIDELVLSSNEDLDSFIYHTSKLKELLGEPSEDNSGIFITPANFIDFSTRMPRHLYIDFDDKGSYEMRYTGI